MSSETKFRISIGNNKTVGGDVIDAQQYVLFFENEDGDFEAQVGCNVAFLGYLMEHDIMSKTMDVHVNRVIETKEKEGDHFEPG